MTASGSKKVLLATTLGGYAHAVTCDAMLGDALSIRGATVEYLLCDAALPACQMSKMGRASPQQLVNGDFRDYCAVCMEEGRRALGGRDYPVRNLSQFLADGDHAAVRDTVAGLSFEELRTYSRNGVSLGEHAYAGALRYFARGDLAEEPSGETVLRRYLESAILTEMAVRRAIEDREYDVVVSHHGIYTPQGIICETARTMGVRTVTYNPAYRKSCFVFSHDRSYHFTMLEEPTQTWEKVELTDHVRALTRSYLHSRRFGTADWIWFHDAPQEDVSGILREIGVDPDRPYVCLLTSVVWDAQLHYASNAFPSMIDWVVETVRYWAGRQDIQLVIRVHPAEIRGAVPSRQTVQEELAKAFDELPPGVFVVAPDSQASTYALCEGADSVLIYNTKAGVEMASLGRPVVVAGEAWIRGKGFSLDANSPQQYFDVLDRLPIGGAIEPAVRERAEKYAFHFFFRRMLPLPFIKQLNPARFELEISGVEDLAPGRWPGLDVICEGILNGSPFVLRAEDLSPAATGYELPARTDAA